MLLWVEVISVGCWSSREFDTLALVKGVGIDLTEKDRIKYTVQLASSKEQSNGQSEGGAATWTTSATGYTLFEANRNLIKKVGKRAFYPHTDIIVIGEELARQGIKPYLDFFNRDPEIRRRTYLVIARNKEAEEVLAAAHDLEDISATAIKEIIDGQSINGVIYSQDLREFTIDLLSPTQDPVTAPIQLKGKEKIFIEGGAVFKNDKLVDWLTRKEARGLNWVTQPSEIIGPIVIQKQNGNERISLEVIDVESKLKPEINKDNLKMRIKIKAEGNIAEDLTTGRNIITEENIKQLNKRFAQIVRNEIKAALKASRNNKTDIFGFGEAFEQSFPQQFSKQKSNWQKIYPTVAVEIDIEAEIKRFGMIEKGLGTYK